MGWVLLGCRVLLVWMPRHHLSGASFTSSLSLSNPISQISHLTLGYTNGLSEMSLMRKAENEGAVVPCQCASSKLTDDVINKFGCDYVITATTAQDSDQNKKRLIISLSLGLAVTVL